MKNKQIGIFLDRDGVLNQAYGFRPPNNPSELRLLPGAAAAVRDLNQADFKVFVVTNQGGVGLGYMTPDDLHAIHAKLLEEIHKVGGRIDEIMACIHKPKEGCSCRKPQPGMLTTLAAKHNIDLSKSFMVGDREIDIKAGAAAGTKTILITDETKVETQADHICDSLTTAAQLILKLTSL